MLIDSSLVAEVAHGVSTSAAHLLDKVVEAGTHPWSMTLMQRRVWSEAVVFINGGCVRCSVATLGERERRIWRCPI
jgi:hypothetical protein